MREDQTIEIDGPPVFERGDKVRAVRTVKDDGTFPGARRGQVLIEAGEIGYVKGIGEFLQRYYIYDVDYYRLGIIVGMRGHELERVED